MKQEPAYSHMREARDSSTCCNTVIHCHKNTMVFLNYLARYLSEVNGIRVELWAFSYAYVGCVLVSGMVSGSHAERNNPH